MEEENIKTQRACVNHARVSSDPDSMAELGICFQDWKNDMINAVSELSAKAMEITMRTNNTIERRLLGKFVRIHVQ